MKLTHIGIVLIMFLISYCLYADSPLTSTDFSTAYQDSLIIQIASLSDGQLTTELMDYLIDNRNPIDLKVAVINKLGWDFDGKNNSSIFHEYLNKNNVILEADETSADILICFAYLKAMDDYFSVDDAITYAMKAKNKNERSYTINIICALIQAQKALSSDWGEVYRLVNDVQLNDGLIEDMKKDAVRIIFEYMNLYKKYSN